MKAVVIYFILSILSMTAEGQNIFYQNASWSPDGKKICAEVIKKNQNDISFEGYIIDVSEKKS